jgi:hypothetical protein
VQVEHGVWPRTQPLHLLDLPEGFLSQMALLWYLQVPWPLIDYPWEPPVGDCWTVTRGGDAELIDPDGFIGKRLVLAVRDRVLVALHHHRRPGRDL